MIFNTVTYILWKPACRQGFAWILLLKEKPEHYKVTNNFFCLPEKIASFI